MMSSAHTPRNVRRTPRSPGPVECPPARMRLCPQTPLARRGPATPPTTPPGTPPRSRPDSPIEVHAAPDPYGEHVWGDFRPQVRDELDLSNDDMEAERERQRERRQQHQQQMRRRELEQRQEEQHGSPSLSQRGARPRQRRANPDLASQRRRTPPRMEWQEEDLATQAMPRPRPSQAADEQPDWGEDPVVGQDPPQQPNLQGAEASPPRRSGRTRQPPQWYTPPPQ